MSDQYVSSMLSPAEVERSTQSAVLGHLLTLHPIHTTESEIVRELSNASDEFAACDDVATAVGALVRIGLAYRHGQFIVPTRAALHASSLMY